MAPDGIRVTGFETDESSTVTYTVVAGEKTTKRRFRDCVKLSDDLRKRLTGVTPLPNPLRNQSFDAPSDDGCHTARKASFPIAAEATPHCPWWMALVVR